MTRFCIDQSLPNETAAGSVIIAKGSPGHHTQRSLHSWTCIAGSANRGAGRHILSRTIVGLLVCLFCLFAPGGSLAIERGFKAYVDPAKRFSFDYPATMTVKPESLNEVKVFHPKATLRITVFIEKRSSNRPPRAAPLLEALKKRLKDEMESARVLKESELSDPDAPQGYVICYFKDKRGVGLVQLVHYYVAQERLLQMVVSDRPEGFKNLASVIHTIHESLKILSPGLK